MRASASTVRCAAGWLLAVALVAAPGVGGAQVEAPPVGAARDASSVAKRQTRSDAGGSGQPGAGLSEGKPAQRNAASRASPASAKPGAAPRREASGAHDLVSFANGPYPLNENILVPGTDERFFSQGADNRRVHVAPRGGTLFEDRTYGDPRSLVVVPRAFDPAAQPVIVLFLHGNLATLTRDVVGRQKVVAQVERSGLNAVLLAPQLAVDALDSSPGRFYEADVLDRYLGEAAAHLARRSPRPFAAADVARWPLIIVAYSGGYLAAAYCLPQQSASRHPIAGVVLLDALFGEEAKFARWIEGSGGDAFFVSAYSPSSAAANDRLTGELKAKDIRPAHELPDAIRAGTVVFRSVPSAVHNDFVTAAWTRDPLADVLARIRRGREGGASGQPDRAINPPARSR